MEATRRTNWLQFQKALYFLLFGLFTATAHAQILGLGAPVITVQPVGTNVQNGDTATFTTSAYCTAGTICSVTWFFNGKALPTNATVVVNGLNTTTISSTLTVKHISSACAGTYSVQIEDELLGGLLGILTATATSQNAALSIIPTVTAVSSGSAMVAKGFQMQFSGPTGSNLVIEASSDLRTWTPISTNVISGGVVSYVDAAAQSHPSRFYRAKLQ